MQLSRLLSNKGEDTSTRASILPEGTPLEFHVLLSACRVFLGTEEPERLEGLLGQGPDWDRLLALASRHGVMPLLYRSIGRLNSQVVPQDWMARLRARYMQNAARNIRMTGELLRILNILKEAGIKAIPLKGPILAQTLYSDVAIRQFSDLDILVACKYLDKALIALEKKGYKIIDDQRNEKSQKKRTALMKQIHHCVLTNESSGTYIELHWQFSPKIFRLNTKEDAVWNRAKTDFVLGKEVLCLSNEDNFLFLCQHGARHLWKNLSWLCDITRLLMIDKINLASAIEISKETKNEKVIALGILLAEELMNTSGLEKIINRSIIDKDLKYLSNKIIEGITSFQDVQDQVSQMVADQVLYKTIFNSQKEKIAFYYEWSMSLTKSDFNSIHLPDLLFPIYKLVRFVRLVKTYGRTFRKQLNWTWKDQ